MHAGILLPFPFGNSGTSSIIPGKGSKDETLINRPRHCCLAFPLIADQCNHELKMIVWGGGSSFRRTACPPLCRKASSRTEGGGRGEKQPGGAI